VEEAKAAVISSADRFIENSEKAVEKIGEIRGAAG